MHTENDIKIERCKIIKSSKTVNASLKKGVFSFDLKFVYRLGVYQFQQQQELEMTFHRILKTVRCLIEELRSSNITRLAGAPKEKLG